MKTMTIKAAGCLLTFCLFCAMPALAQNVYDPSLPGVPHHNDDLTSPEELVLCHQSGLDEVAGMTALDAGNFAVAEADFRLSISESPSGDAVSYLAQTLIAEGRIADALQEYQQTPYFSQDDRPRDLLPYALLLLKVGRWAQAVSVYNKALSQVADRSILQANCSFSTSVPQSVDLAAAIHIALGLTYSWECDMAGNNQSVKAQYQFGKALALEPDSDLANYYYGYGLQRLGRTAEAKAAFTKTLKIAHGAVKIAARKALAQQKKAA